MRTAFAGLARTGWVWLLAICAVGLVSSEAYADVFQTPPGHTASATVTLTMVLRPKVNTGGGQNNPASFDTVSNPPRNMHVFYRIRPGIGNNSTGLFHKTLTTQTAVNRTLQVGENTLRSIRGQSIQALTKEVVSSGAHSVELSTVFL